MDTTARARVDSLLEECTRLRAVEVEYRVTVKVLAVITERLLQHTAGEHVVISDDALADSPDLIAWRDGEQYQVILTVSR